MTTTMSLSPLPPVKGTFRVGAARRGGSYRAEGWRFAMGARWTVTGRATGGTVRPSERNRTPVLSLGSCGKHMVANGYEPSWLVKARFCIRANGGIRHRTRDKARDPNRLAPAALPSRRTPRIPATFAGCSSRVVVMTRSTPSPLNLRGASRWNHPSSAPGGAGARKRSVTPLAHCTPTHIQFDRPGSRVPVTSASTDNGWSSARINRPKTAPLEKVASAQPIVRGVPATILLLPRQMNRSAVPGSLRLKALARRTLQRNIWEWC
jgi:hypothetical protein